MNIFDIVIIAIFALLVIACAIKGFFKILSDFGALFGAIILSRLFGGALGELLNRLVLEAIAEKINFAFIENIIGYLMPMVGTAVLFVLLYLLLRLVFSSLSKLC